MTRGLVMSVLSLAATLAHAEGDGPRARAKQLLKRQAEAARLKQAPAPAALRSLVPAPAASQPKSQPHARECDKSDTGWRAWRDEKIGYLLTLEPKSKLVRQPYLDNESVMERSTEIANWLHDCAELASFPPESLMGNFTNFVRAHRNANYQFDLKHQFGHQPEDRTYLRRAEAQLTLPCLLQTPVFLKHISNPESYHQAWKLIEQHNREGVTEVLGCPTNGEKWTPLIYRSKFLPTPDYAETFGRFFVLVRGGTDKDYDRWIQFGIWLPEDETKRPGDYGNPVHNVSVVSVARGADPRADNRFDAIADWWRIAKDGESGLELKFRRETPPYETDNCVRCHKTLPIGIHPAALYKFNDDGQLTKVDGAKRIDGVQPADRQQILGPDPATVLAELRSYIFKHYRRAPIYETAADDAIASPQNYGPAFGPAKARTVGSLRSCTAPHRLSSDSVRRVMKGMICGHCHNGQPNAPDKFNVGLLNYPLATERRTHRLDNDAYPNLIRSHISSGVMPPERPGEPPLGLTVQERAALYDCLSQEYFKPNRDPRKSTGLFVDWLRNKPTAPP